MAKVPEFTQVRIPRININVDASLNSRKTISMEEIGLLAKSLKAQGVLHPPIVIRSAQLGDKFAKKGEYTLIAGFRRQAALDLIAGDNVGDAETAYSVAPSDWTMIDALSANLTENLSRNDLSTFEVASQCYTMKDVYGLSTKEIALRVRAQDGDAEAPQAMSDKHVNNLIRCIEKLHPVILKNWKECHAACSLKWLIASAANDDKEDQLFQWKVRIGEIQPEPDTDEGGEGDDNDGEGVPPPKKPTKSMIEKMLAAIPDSDKSAEWKAGATIAFRWTLGNVSRIPGVSLKKKSAEDDE
jgi:ParB-like nuclease domain